MRGLNIRIRGRRAEGQYRDQGRVSGSMEPF